GRSPEETISDAACRDSSTASSSSGTGGIASCRSRRRKEERFIAGKYRLETRAASWFSCTGAQNRVTFTHPSAVHIQLAVVHACEIAWPGRRLSFATSKQPSGNV